MDGRQAVTAAAPEIVAGIGFSSRCTGDDILAVVAQALRTVGLGPDRLSALAAPAFKAGRPCLVQAVATLAVPLVLVPDAALAAAQARTPSSSGIAEAATGIASVAEAAALVAAGPGGQLVLAKIKTAWVTCALASRPYAPVEIA